MGKGLLLCPEDGTLVKCTYVNGVLQGGRRVFDNFAFVPLVKGAHS